MSRTCFVCGPENPSGLHITFTEVPGGGCRAEYTVPAAYSGWPDIVHGGILFTLMDEAVAWAMVYAGLRGVTAKAEARFRSPAHVGRPLVVLAQISEPPRRTVRAHAEIRDGGENGPVLTEMDAVMVVAGRLEGDANA